MRTMNWPAITALILSSFIVGCDDTKQNSAVANSETKHLSVGILQFGNHPVLNKVEAGVKDRLKEFYGDAITLEVFNGNLDNSALRHYAEKLQSGPYDAVVTISTPATIAYQGTNSGAKPVVFTFVTNPEQVGYTQAGSIKNATGLSNQTDYHGTLNLMRRINPKGKTYGYLVSSREPNATYIKDRFVELGRNFDIEFKVTEIVKESEVGIVAEKLATDVDGFLIGGDHNVVKAAKSLVRVADYHKKPVFSVDGSTLENGVVAASTIDFYEMGKRTGEYVAFILAGVKPERISLEKYAAYKIVLNRNALLDKGLSWPAEWNGNVVFYDE